MDEALVNMVVNDSQPFSIVEDVGFKELIHALDPTYILPTRQVCMCDSLTTVPVCLTAYQ